MKKVIFAVVIIFMMSACATTSTVTPAEDLTSASATLPKLDFTSIQIKVKTEVEDSIKETQQLKEFLVNEIKAKNKEVVESETDADAEMVIIITYLKKVSRGSRLLWGSLSGKAKLKLDITLTNNTDSINFLVDTSSAGASSSADWFSGHGGTTQDMLERTAAKIVAEIL